MHHGCMYQHQGWKNAFPRLKGGREGGITKLNYLKRFGKRALDAEK